jgi:hypothetical protein
METARTSGLAISGKKEGACSFQTCCVKDFSLRRQKRPDGIKTFNDISVGQLLLPTRPDSSGIVNIFVVIDPFIPLRFFQFFYKFI